MAKGRKRRDPRTEEQLVATICAAIHNSGSQGIGALSREESPTGKRETAQRHLARITQIPQWRVNALRAHVIAKYGELYPGGEQPFFNLRDNSYVGSTRPRPGDLIRLGGDLATMATKGDNVDHLLDVAECSEDLRDLRSEVQAVNTLIRSLHKRGVKVFANESRFGDGGDGSDPEPAY